MTHTFTDLDRAFMTRALQLAALGLNTTHPNPRVGCVVVQGERIVGEGWHRKAGEPHAETHALQAAGAAARGATAYVTLEPCSHVGRTPPCADALIAAGVTRVMVASGDPNPLVNGKGIEKLRAAGVEVFEGLLRDEAETLNVGFIKRMRQGLPWVRMKVGVSLDGRTALANGVSQWITGEAARHDVQHWRARSSAILTGVGTVLTDDPQLNVRAADIDLLGREPWRVICDSELRTPLQARVVNKPGALVYTTRTPVSLGAAEVVQVSTDVDGRVDLQAMLRDLARRGCNEVWVEAGPTLCGRLLAAQWVDELVLYLAPVLLGHDARPLAYLPAITQMSERLEFGLLDAQRIGDDVRLRYRSRALNE